MVEVVIVVREVRRAKPEYSLKFELPELPREGDYISINRPDHREPYGEDLIVRRVWWRLHHPDTRVMFEAGDDMTGKLTEIFVECDQATGPYSSDDWRKWREGQVEKFDVERFSIPEADFNKGFEDGK